MMATAATPRHQRRRRLPVGRIVFLGLFLLFVLAPLYWVFVTSIKPSDDYLSVPPILFPTKRRSSTTRRHCSLIAACRGSSTA
jgi:multiple sugar transport system permease protein